MIWHRRGDYPIDTHVLVHHSRARPQWLEQCIASLEASPTSILLVDSDSDHLGQLRAQALTQGNAPCLSFVDDDDWLAPGAFDACLQAITPGSIGAYTDFERIDAETDLPTLERISPAWSRIRQAATPYLILHAKVFRRAACTPAVLVEVAKWPTAEEVILTGLLAGAGDWAKVDMIGAHKRTHEGAGSRITPAMLARAMLTVAPSILGIKRWADTKTGCGTCDAVRGVARRVL